MATATDPYKKTWTIEYEPGDLGGVVMVTPAAIIQGRDHFIETLDHELESLRRAVIAEYDEKYG